MNRARSAFTLLEIMIVVLVLALVIAAAGTALDQAQRFNERISLENELNDKANRVLNDLALELRTCDADPNNLKLGTVTPTAADYSYSAHPELGYSDYTKLIIYQYRVSTGLEWNATKSAFTGKMETTGHRLVYDPQGGTLAKELWDSYATPTTRVWHQVLCDQILPIDTVIRKRGGFYMDQIGNTLAMELGVYSTYRAGYVGETIIKVADSQVLFLRTTLDTNLGSAAYNKSDAVFTGDSTSNLSPTIYFGHMITYTTSLASGASTAGEISIFMQPPIGDGIDTSTVSIQVATYDASGALSTPVTMPEGTPMSSTGYYTNLVKATRPDKNGNVTVTLTTVNGSITGSILVTAAVTSSVSKLTTTVTKSF